MRHLRFPLLLLLALCLTLPETAVARKVVYRLADYGILPNQRGDSLLSSRLDSVLRVLRSRVGEGDRVTLKFAPGRYDLHAADAAPRTLYVSNHDQGQPKRTGIYIEDWHNLTIDGRGAEIICHGRMLPLAVVRSSDVTVKRLAIDFEDPQITQVQVLQNSPTEGITFEVAPWSDWRIAPDGRFESRGEGWTLRPASGIAFERNTRHIVYRTADLGVDTRDCVDLGGNHVRAPHWRDTRLVPGTVVALRSWERPAPGIFLSENVRTRLDDVTVHYAEGMGLLAQNCRDITLDHFRVSLRGENDLRYFTTQADATHFSQCSGRIVSRGGLYEGMMDDAINVHGIYLRVTDRLDDHRLRCTFGHNQAWGFEWGAPGDTVSFIAAATMTERPEHNVITDIRPDGQAEVTGCHGFVITLRDALPKEVVGGNTWGIENMTRTPEITFARNIVRNNRARGALFSSPRRTVCEDNLFDHTSGTAILLCGDCNGWYESGAVRDLVIRRNTFDNALTSLYQFTEAVISICPEIPRLDESQPPFHGGKSGAILIERNTFNTFDAPLLYAKSARGIVYRRNKVRRNSDYTPFHPNREAIRLDYCPDATIDTGDQAK